MKAITVRNLPPRVARAVRQRAKKDHLSLNGAVIRLLEERLSEPSPEPSGIQDDLDFLYGAWTKPEAQAFDESLSRQRAIDAELWK